MFLTVALLFSRNWNECHWNFVFRSHPNGKFIQLMHAVVISEWRQDPQQIVHSIVKSERRMGNIPFKLRFFSSLLYHSVTWTKSCLSCWRPVKSASSVSLRFSRAFLHVALPRPPIQNQSTVLYRWTINSKYRREGCCCLGDRIDSIPCRASYFAPGWLEEIVWSKMASAARNSINSVPKQQRWPLPSLLYLSFYPIFWARSEKPWASWLMSPWYSISKTMGRDAKRQVEGDWMAFSCFVLVLTDMDGILF